MPASKFILTESEIRKRISDFKNYAIKRLKYPADWLVPNAEGLYPLGDVQARWEAWQAAADISCDRHDQELRAILSNKDRLHAEVFRLRAKQSDIDIQLQESIHEHH